MLKDCSLLRDVPELARDTRCAAALWSAGRRIAYRLFGDKVTNCLRLSSSLSVPLFAAAIEGLQDSAAGVIGVTHRRCSAASGGAPSSTPRG